MQEQDKLEEAIYFLNEMRATESDPIKFKYNTSGFLSAARSVLQFALKEAQTKKGGQFWYDTIIKNNPTLEFFKDKRDVNIHSKPVDINRDVNIAIADTLHISYSVHIEVRDSDGNLKDEYNSGEPVKKEKTYTPPITTYRLYFNDWNGTEDIFQLSEMYINQLSNIIKDGQTKGFLT